jgi:hypothetical protein
MQQSKCARRSATGKAHFSFFKEKTEAVGTASVASRLHCWNYPSLPLNPTGITGGGKWRLASPRFRIRVKT